MIKPSQHSRLIPIVLGLVLGFSMMSCTKQKIRKINHLFENGKWDKALKKSDKLFEKKHDHKKWGRKVQLLNQQALYYSLIQDPSIPRLYAFLYNYPSSQYRSEVRKLLYQELLNHPIEQEAMLLAYFHSSPDILVGNSFLIAAEELAWDAIADNPSAKELHSFLLRYPSGKHSQTAKNLESNQAFKEAQSQNDVPTWSEFIRNYPDHPQIAEAQKGLRQVEWIALSKDSTPAELWEYAEKFKDTEEGWLSAATAYSQAIFTTLNPQGTEQILEEGQVLTDTFQNFSLNFQGKLPIGFQSAISTEVKVNDEWIFWNQAMMDWAKQLKVSSMPKDVEVYEQLLNQNGWSTDFGICTLGSEPVPVRLCGTLSYEQKEHRNCTELMVSPQCNGARQMIFSTYEDDIVGPIGGLQYNSIEQKWELIVVGSSIPEQWTCTHIYENTTSGVKVVCGEFLMHIGWLENSFAIQPSPEDLHQIDRITLEPWVNEPNLPLTLKKNTLLDGKKKVMFDVGDRQVHLSPSVAENAFQPRNQQFSLQDAQEDILSNDRILPHNSSETSMLQPDSQSSQNIGYVLENFMKNTQPIAFGKNVQLGEDLWGTAYLILTEPTPYLALQYEDDWVHFIHIPLMTGSILEKFYTFEKDDRYYLRLFGQNATNQIRLVSISIPDADAVMEVKDLSLQ